MGTKKNKRQVDVSAPAMTVGGQVVAYQNSGDADTMGTKAMTRSNHDSSDPRQAKVSHIRPYFW